MNKYMIINSLGDYFHRFPGMISDHSLKLSEITSKKAVQLSNEQMLISDQAYPNKFEVEMIRFWRKKGLLPFFEDGKHAQISLAQLMWLRFLSELRNLSSGTQILEKAHEYLIKRAYDDDLAEKNLINLKDKLKDKIKENPTDQVAIHTLKIVRGIQADPMLLYSLKMDINYFSAGIIDSVINNNNVSIVYGLEKEYLDKDGHFEITPIFKVVINNDNDQITSSIKPIVIFPVRYFIEDVFSDCNISENAFNIQILNDKEKELFLLIRGEKIKEVKLYSIINNDEFISLIIMNNNRKHNADGIKKLKLTLCTNNYKRGVAILTNGEEYFF
jgi:hypothetical protein